ncbi:RNase adapter RapZ [Candidatus Acidulodesulfobacterium sp. H_13]|uniref:RNase adapter RapZ n=1 Tax=Candidatus Acidulodesulfobacterium sp. H_13 TaxID=3395470 RepID=UPI003AF5A38E
MKENAEKPNIVLISGVSGSGKSSALKIFEDKGFFCVDNMPMLLLPKFFELGLSARLKNILFVIDIREKSFLNEFENYIKFLRNMPSFFKFIFFDARDEILIRRYSETRRKHPISEGNILTALKKERQLLFDAKLNADIVVDTSDIKIHDLEGILTTRLKGLAAYSASFSVKIISFGFKYGLPLEADTVFDARFLPNPFFIPPLKDFTGMSRKIAKYMLSFSETDKFIEYIRNFLIFTLPLYKEENKSYFTVGVGCTGGVHRSVFVVEELKKRLGNVSEEYDISYFHRDMKK